MGQHSLRLAVVAGVVVGGALAGVVAVAGNGSQGAPHVTITMRDPCRNAQPVVIGEHAWDSMDVAPAQWGKAERGTFTVTRPGEALFRSDRDGRKVTFHENENRMTRLFCVASG